MLEFCWNLGGHPTGNAMNSIALQHFMALFEVLIAIGLIKIARRFRISAQDCKRLTVNMALTRLEVIFLLCAINSNIISAINIFYSAWLVRVILTIMLCWYVWDYNFKFKDLSIISEFVGRDCLVEDICRSNLTSEEKLETIERLYSGDHSVRGIPEICSAGSSVGNNCTSSSASMCHKQT